MTPKVGGGGCTHSSLQWEREKTWFGLSTLMLLRRVLSPKLIAWLPEDTKCQLELGVQANELPHGLLKRSSSCMNCTHVTPFGTVLLSYDSRILVSAAGARL